MRSDSDHQPSGSFQKEREAAEEGLRVTDRPPGFFEGTGMPDPGWWEALWPDPAKVLSDVGVAPGMVVIDLCSGDGWFTLPLARIARRVVAIDIDVRLLEAAMVRIAERGGAPNCAFIEADAYDIVLQEPLDHVFLPMPFMVFQTSRALRGLSMMF